MTNENAPVPEIRVSHADRDRVAEQLRVAAGDGRLTMEELDERLERALNARTGSELAVLTTDLPATTAAGTLVPAVAKESTRIEVSSGSTVREGRWAVPRAMDVKIGSGSVRLDLTHAVVTEPLLRISAEVRSGSLTIVTRPGVEVIVDEVSVSSGSAKVRRAEGEHLVPTELRIEVSGSVKSGSIVARPPRRGFMDWLLRRKR
jgi:Domain of unknown function (DUF1707)